jgi:hypothetical protein
MNVQLNPCSDSTGKMKPRPLQTQLTSFLAVGHLFTKTKVLSIQMILPVNENSSVVGNFENVI